MSADDGMQSEIRLNPEIECPEERHDSLNDYPFVKLSLNKIQLNGNDWTALSRKFRAAGRGDSLFTVVYLGDSHVQADFGGAEFRQRMCGASRSAGRGLVIPFKLAGTNEPTDYTFQTPNPYVSSRLLKMPWATDMLFTGISVQPAGRDFAFNVSCGEPFDRMRFISHGDYVVKYIHADGDTIVYSLSDNEIRFDRHIGNVEVGLSGDRTVSFGGAVLLSDSVGTVVHSIGNNGATYSSYGLAEGFGSGLESLAPDLIVIALGTNEAFGRSSVTDIEADIESLVGTIRRHCPSAQLLMVTPAGCYKKVCRRVRRRNGRRRRVCSSVVNAKVSTVASVIRRYAEANGIAVYDHYALAGGDAAASELKAAGLLGRDGVHYTVRGYRLWGELLGQAVLAELDSTVEAE